MADICTYVDLTDLYERKYGRNDKELQRIKSYLTISSGKISWEETAALPINLTRMKEIVENLFFSDTIGIGNQPIYRLLSFDDSYKDAEIYMIVVNPKPEPEPEPEPPTDGDGTCMGSDGGGSCGDDGGSCGAEPEPPTDGDCCGDILADGDCCDDIYTDDDVCGGDDSYI